MQSIANKLPSDDITTRNNNINTITHWVHSMQIKQITIILLKLLHKPINL